ncbi:hypothetical protein K474DRAFT_1408296 [Panus rudis PR-1116 ss-1]|nr:hypothetical protein K474DRAFT_1408296 [Panus rudis PR-1116 ss-1]
MSRTYTISIILQSRVSCHQAHLRTPNANSFGSLFTLHRRTPTPNAFHFPIGDAYVPKRLEQPQTRRETYDTIRYDLFCSFLTLMKVSIFYSQMCTFIFLLSKRCGIGRLDQTWT